MIEHKQILRNFSDYPITIENISKKEFDIDSKEFIVSFQWLESEKLIRPLSESTCGLRVDSLGKPCWAIIDIVITQKGKDYLHPIRSLFLKPTAIEICKYIVIVLLGLIIGHCSSYL